MTVVPAPPCPVSLCAEGARHGALSGCPAWRQPGPFYLGAIIGHTFWVVLGARLQLQNLQVFTPLSSVVLFPLQIIYLQVICSSCLVHHHLGYYRLTTWSFCVSVRTVLKQHS